MRCALALLMTLVAVLFPSLASAYSESPVPVRPQAEVLIPEHGDLSVAPDAVLFVGSWSELPEEEISFSSALEEMGVERVGRVDVIDVFRPMSLLSSGEEWTAQRGSEELTHFTTGEELAQPPEIPYLAYAERKRTGASTLRVRGAGADAALLVLWHGPDPPDDPLVDAGVLVGSDLLSPTVSSLENPMHLGSLNVAGEFSGWSAPYVVDWGSPNCDGSLNIQSLLFLGLLVGPRRRRKPPGCGRPLWPGGASG